MSTMHITFLVASFLSITTVVAGLPPGTSPASRNVNARHLHNHRRGTAASTSDSGVRWPHTTDPDGTDAQSCDATKQDSVDTCQSKLTDEYHNGATLLKTRDAAFLTKLHVFRIKRSIFYTKRNSPGSPCFPGQIETRMWFYDGLEQSKPPTINAQTMDTYNQLKVAKACDQDCRIFLDNITHKISQINALPKPDWYRCTTPGPQGPTTTYPGRHDPPGPNKRRRRSVTFGRSVTSGGSTTTDDDEATKATKATKAVIEQRTVEDNEGPAVVETRDTAFHDKRAASGTSCANGQTPIGQWFYDGLVHDLAPTILPQDRDLYYKTKALKTCDSSCAAIRSNYEHKASQLKAYPKPDYYICVTKGPNPKIANTLPGRKPPPKNPAPWPYKTRRWEVVSAWTTGDD